MLKLVYFLLKLYIALNALNHLIEAPFLQFIMYALVLCFTLPNRLFSTLQVFGMLNNLLLPDSRPLYITANMLQFALDIFVLLPSAPLFLFTTNRQFTFYHLASLSPVRLFFLTTLSSCPNPSKKIQSTSPRSTNYTSSPSHSEEEIFCWKMP